MADNYISIADLLLTMFAILLVPVTIIITGTIVSRNQNTNHNEDDMRMATNMNNPCHANNEPLRHIHDNKKTTCC